MNEIKISPNEFFSSNDCHKVIINGISTRIRKMSDEKGNFFAIEAKSKQLSDICGKFVLEKFIIQIDYIKYQGSIAIIKAYF